MRQYVNNADSGFPVEPVTTRKVGGRPRGPAAFDARPISKHNSVVKGSLASAFAKRRERIDARGAVRRHEAGDDGNGRQDGGDREEGHRVRSA